MLHVNHDQGRDLSLSDSFLFTFCLTALTVTFSIPTIRRTGQSLGQVIGIQTLITDYYSQGPQTSPSSTTDKTSQDNDQNIIAPSGTTLDLYHKCC